MDLRHWDYAEGFSEIEVGELIIGHDPTSLGRSGKALPVRRRICDCFEKAVRAYLDAALWGFDEPALDERSKVFQSTHLRSTSLMERESQWLSGKLSDRNFSDWLDSYEAHIDADQVFGRKEVARWLQAIGLESAYPFSSSDRQRTPNGWPWGHHSTKLLEHLDAAAQRYYGANYDPNDSTTAPTNAAVSEWLQSDRKVSKLMADSIASMLRPDGLPTGPRK